MANTSVEYSADGVTTDFTFSFPYLNIAHVEVYKNDVRMSEVTHFNFVGAGTVRFVAAPVLNDAIKIKRNTDINTRLVDYQSGAVLTEAELDLDSKQAFYLAQEVKDNYSDYFEAAILRLATALGVVETEPAAVEAALVQTLLDNTLATEIQDRITDIDVNASAILSLSTTVQDWGISILANETDITAIDARVTSAESDILTNAGVASANAGAISALDVRVTSNEGDINVNATDITALTATVDLRNRTFRQPAAPVADNIGDIWIDTDDNNKIYRWNGTIWEDSHDGQISATATSLTALESRVTTAEGDIASAEVTILANTNATVSNAGDITNLEAHYGVTLNVNGYITGFSQLNDGTSGSFQILADQFYIVDPASGGQNPTIPFAVVSGEVFLENVTIASAGQSGTGQRTEISSANNELYFYGDRGDASVTLQATIGINTYVSDNVVGYFGSTAAGQSNIALLGLSNTNRGIFAVSVAHDGIYGATQSTAANGRAGVQGISGTGNPSYGVRGGSQSGTGAGVFGEGYADKGTVGVHGVHRASIGSLKTGVGVLAEHEEPSGIPLRIERDSSSNVPTSVGLSGGELFVPNNAIAMLGRIDNEWVDVARRPESSASFGTGTSVSHTDIPAGCDRIVISVFFCHTNGTVAPRIQLGNGSYITTGYNFGVNSANTSAGFIMASAWGSSSYWTGEFVIQRVVGNTWVCTMTGHDGITTTYHGAGYRSYAGEIDRWRIYMDGVDVFDNGDYCYRYEL